MRKDTRHKIYTGLGRQGGELYVLFEDQVWRLVLVCLDACETWVPLGPHPVAYLGFYPRVCHSKILYTVW
jgi:hypothetical protein